MLKSQHYLRVSPTDVGLNRSITTDHRKNHNRITHGRGFESQNQAVLAQSGKAVSPTDVGLNRIQPRSIGRRGVVSPTDVGLNRRTHGGEM